MKLAAIATAAALTALPNPAPAQDYEEGSLESLCQKTSIMAEMVMEDRMSGTPLATARQDVRDTGAVDHSAKVMLNIVEVAYDIDVTQRADSDLTPENHAIMQQVLYGMQVEDSCRATLFWTDLD